MLHALLGWGLLLAAGAWAADWGSERVAAPLKDLCRHWGLTAAGATAILSAASSSPEVGVNVASAARGVTDIGLGTLLGSNIVSVPVVVGATYLATRVRGVPGEPGEHPDGEHDRHRRRHRLAIDPDEPVALVVPYLLVIALVGVLTLPPGWRGLDPIDGAIVLVAYLLYLFHAFSRSRDERDRMEAPWPAVGRASLGLVVVAIGAYAVVVATERLAEALGLSQLVGGLFLTSIVATLPEGVTSWNLAREGMVTTGATSVLADNTVTFTLAFLPLALVTVPIGDPLLYTVNLAAVALFGLLFALFHVVGRPGFRRWQVVSLVVAYAGYAAVVLALA